MKTSWTRSFYRSRAARWAGFTASIWCASACYDIDTRRVAPPPATLGDDIYGMLCDRVGAGALAEDLTGASYHAVCHYTNEGAYADEVDQSLLPDPTSAESKNARTLGVAKVEAMARRRSDLIRAFNATFPDIEIDNVATMAAGDKIRLHDALMKFMQSIAPLYESDPFAAGGQPLLPATTRGLGRMFAAMMDSAPAREALSNIQGRRGYRPVQSGLGVIRPALAYPQLRQLAHAALSVVGPGGPAEPLLQQLLRVVKQELATSAATVEPLAPFTVDLSTMQPNRPRSAMEVTGAILLAEHPSFELNATEPARYIVKRDRHGFVIPLGNTPGLAGTVPSPFIDSDTDGFADVDPFGRQLVSVGGGVTPFVIPGESSFAADGFGRPAPALYQYIDTSRTALGSVLRNIAPLVDPTQVAAPGDPDAWQSEHETLMYALAGARVLFGPREEAQYDYTTETIHPAGVPCTGCVPYERFRGEDSPIPDLVHALGQLLADPDSDMFLEALLVLVDDHPNTVARLMGAALRLREIAKEHDELAAQGLEPFASLPYETPIWDEMAGVVARITQRPGLLTKLLGALADDKLVTPIGGAAGLGDAFSRFARARDEMNYDPNDLNGPALNLTDPPPSALDPHTPVDWAQPMTGKNRSCLERTLKAIHDVNGVKACNKQGATVEAKVGFLSVSWPLIGSYSECELFQFDNLGGLYLDSLLPPNHPKRAQIEMKPGELEAILAFLNLFISTDELFETSSGITGLSLKPTTPALNRLVLFGASSTQFPNMPDLDPYLGPLLQNSQTNLFISSLIEPAPTSGCPKKSNGVNACAAMEGTVRIADRNSIFLLERLGMYEYLQPLVTVFANEACNASVTMCNTDDYTGEQILIDLIDVLYRHWPNGKGQSYEPILVDAFGSDFLPALHEFAKVAVTTNITVRRGPNAGQQVTGAQALELAARIMFDPAYAAQVSMVDRKGSKTTQWVDGTPQLQLTGFTLFADALHKIDTRFGSACDCTGLSGKPLADCQAFQGACPADTEMRKGQWKRARSQLVDQFLAVEGEGPGATFKNPGLPRMLRTILQVMREQLNANCSNRENGGGCDWAKRELGEKLSTTVSGPLFASLVDLTDALRSGEASRRELERLLTYLLQSSPDADTLQSTLASVSDLLQLVPADRKLSPIFQSVAVAASPDDDPDGAGPTSAILKVLKALSGDDYDRYHVLDHILPGLVTPIPGSAGVTPIEVIMDTISEINRIDASMSDPLDPADYEFVLKSTRDFLTSETRGLEQLYFIVQNRPRK